MRSSSKDVLFLIVRVGFGKSRLQPRNADAHTRLSGGDDLVKIHPAAQRANVKRVIQCQGALLLGPGCEAFEGLDACLGAMRMPMG
jgi:hypothetical protein